MSGKSFVVIGCGKQARAIALYLAKKAKAARITLVDKDSTAATRLANWLGKFDIPNDVINPSSKSFDAMQPAEDSAKVMDGYDAVINAAGNAMNFHLTKAAIMARVHYCDIGHDDDMIDLQQSLSDAATLAKVAIMPGCGIAPGGSQVATRYVIECFNRMHGGMPEEVNIRCGGIPLKRFTTPLDYVAGFSLNGLVTECKIPSKVLRNGKETTEDSLGDIEQLGRIKGFGDHIFEACATGGNLGTLTRSYAERIQAMDYRTIRWPGHWKFLKTLDHYGLFDNTKLPDNDSSARDATVEYLRKLIPDVSRNFPDALVLRITASSSNPYRKVQFDMVVRFEQVTGQSAMELATGISAAIVAEMLATGVITQRGVLTQESGIPTRAFMDAWSEAGLQYDIIQTP